MDGTEPTANAPALDHLSAFSFSRHTNGIATKVEELRQAAIYTEGHFSSKVKVLAAALWSVSVRCEPCLKFYVKQAKEYGASNDEIGEFLGIAPAMGACVGEMWALKAFEVAIAETEAVTESCCHDDQTQ